MLTGQAQGKNLSLLGWERTMQLLGREMRPQVETVQISIDARGITLTGCSTTATCELGVERKDSSPQLDYMIPEARCGGGCPPPNHRLCDLWGRDMIEVGRLAVFFEFFLGDVRIYSPNPPPCRVCDGRGVNNRRDTCSVCKGSGLQVEPDSPPHSHLWERRDY